VEEGRVPAEGAEEVLSVNWDGHRYTSLISTNCWAPPSNAAELGWTHKDDSVLVKSRFCKGVWDGSVYPDEFKKYSSKCKGVSTVAPNCPPLPEIHHSVKVMSAVYYYVDLLRELFQRGADPYHTGFVLGQLFHVMGDVIIRPFKVVPHLFSLESFWDYEEIATPISEHALELPPDCPAHVPEGELKFALFAGLISLRAACIRGRYKEVAEGLVGLMKGTYARLKLGI